MVAFNQIPTDVRTPGVFVEVDPSQAEQGVFVAELRSVLIAQKLAAGNLAAGQVQSVTSHEAVVAAAGAGSMADRMAKRWFEVNPITPLDLVLLDDAGTGFAIKTLTFGGAISPGQIAVYIAGDRYVLTVTAGSTLNSVRDELSAIFNTPTNAQHNPNAPVTVSTSATEGQVVIVANNSGEVGNTIDVRVSHLSGEALPAGMTATVADSVAGTGNPSVASALAAIDGVQYDVILHPYTDSSNLGLLEANLEQRADAMQGIPGIAITGTVGVQTVLAAIGGARNSEFSTIFGFEVFPGVACERAASCAAAIARYGSSSPVRPFQTLSIPGFAPAQNQRFSQAERNLLLKDGISTTRVIDGDQVQIERAITTYQTNPAGGESTAFLNVNTMLTTSWFRKSVSQRLLARFPRHALASDSTTVPLAQGAEVATPKLVKGELVAWYQQAAELGFVEDVEGFIRNSVFERSATDPDRVDMLLAPNYVNQYRVSGLRLAFRL